MIQLEVRNTEYIIYKTKVYPIYTIMIKKNNKSNNVLLIIIGVILTGWLLYSWLPTRNIEKPAYTVVSKADGYEIRSYSPYIIAETTILDVQSRGEAARKAFPIVAGYIFGGNTSKDMIAMTTPVNTQGDDSEKIAMTVPVNTEKIAMTTPVNTEALDKKGSYKVSFVIPSRYTLETLPTPNDSRVELKEVPARNIAVKRFSWSSSESKFSKKEKELLLSLERDDVTTISEINIARYNTPWTIPFMLRNEVQIEVDLNI
jgi:hypothetical protein